MKDFQGSSSLKNIYNKITEDINKIYQTGKSFCFAGMHGVGKTTVATNILKKACQRNYSCLYTTLTDMVNVLVDFNDEKVIARKELMLVDFLVIDEFDSRFINAGNSSDLFGRSLEHIFRTRSSNKLPTIFCSNSPNPVESFSGALKQSIDSLMAKVHLLPILGSDFRKVGESK